jgi:hypothetical protein
VVARERRHSRQARHAELRDELVAILGAGRELSDDSDRDLADAFIRHLERGEAEPQERDPHQPHYSLMVAGAMWGMTAIFLFLLLVLNNPKPVYFVVAASLLLVAVRIVSRTFLFLARTGWQRPYIQLTVTPPKRRTRESR